jgi:hypothetical protein
MARLSRLPSRCETSVKTGGILIEAEARSKRKEHTSLSPLAAVIMPRSPISSAIEPF